MNLLKIKDLSKSFGDKRVLNKINLSINKNKIITIFGPNGCGKSTLLNIIAGIINQDSGDIVFNLNKNNIGFVFQNYRDSLLPWKNNLDNIAFSLEIKGVDLKKRRNDVEFFLKKLNIELPLYSFPYQCSGGEQQLVSILREVITKPSIILMDEPFSALNIENKIYLRKLIQEIKDNFNLTIILVTHDLFEAIQLGDKVVLMTKSGTIKKTYDVKFKRPRLESMFLNKKFINLEKEIMCDFLGRNF
jgi:NitT/TauT family transport system ATP-binding protein